MVLTHEQIITLQCLEGCGAATINKIAAFARANDSTISGLSELYEFIDEGIAHKAITRYHLPSFEEFRDANSDALKLVEKTEKYGISIVSQFDKDFPPALLNTVDEHGKPSNPILLYYKGNLSITERPCVAIIGTREPTKEGIMAGEYFGTELARLGANIVSGLALGCGTAGHKGALSADGVTTAIVGNGLDTVYPQENTKLASQIIDSGGLMFSEYPIGTTAGQYNLVARDRLQAALSWATIVIQTSVNGGTMHAANATLQSQKPLYVVKYDSKVKDKVDGNDLLLSRGAVPLSSSSELSLLLKKLSTSVPRRESNNECQGNLFPLD